MWNVVERVFIFCDDDKIGLDDFVLVELLNDEWLFEFYNLIEVEKMLIFKVIDSYNGNFS